MKTLLHPSAIVRFVSCAAAVAGLGIASAVASPVITIPLQGQTFGIGEEIRLVSKGTLNASSAYTFNVTGTCEGTGSLKGVIPAGTPISTVFAGVKLKGTYQNPGGKLPISVLNKKYSKSITVQGAGKVTLSAMLKAGTEANGKVYFDVTKVKIAAKKPIPAGGVRFGKGSKMVITAAPVVEFNAISTNVDEFSGNVTIRVNKVGTGKTVVKYSTSDDTANSGDYTAVTDGTISFPAKTGPMNISIPITQNTDKDGFRRFKVTLSSISGSGVLGKKTVHTVGIRDDD